MIDKIVIAIGDVVMKVFAGVGFVFLAMLGAGLVDVAFKDMGQWVMALVYIVMMIAYYFMDMEGDWTSGGKPLWVVIAGNISMAVTLGCGLIMVLDWYWQMWLPLLIGGYWVSLKVFVRHMRALTNYLKVHRDTLAWMNGNHKEMKDETFGNH